MKHSLFVCLAVFFCFHTTVFGQIPIPTLVQIVKAEDARRFDAGIENFLTNPNEKIRARAALAAGRIGDDAAIPFLANLLEKDSRIEVRAAAAFAIGEIESSKGADALLQVLQNTGGSGEIRARAVEAAGKIAAANAKDPLAPKLGRAIVSALEFEMSRGGLPRYEIVLPGITAVLRARPEGGEAITASFLSDPNPRIRADAANTLSRLRAKNAYEKLRSMLASDTDAIARANAARALGAAEDKEAFNILLDAAVSDKDSRVRVSAIRSLAALKKEGAAGALKNRAGELLKSFASKKMSVEYPKEKSELLEIFAALGRLLANSNDQTAVSLIESFRETDRYSSAESEIAYARIAPAGYLKNHRNAKQKLNWRTTSALAQGLGEFVNSPDENLKIQARTMLVNRFIELVERVPRAQIAEMNKAVPDLLTALAAFKPDNLNLFLLEMIVTGDVHVRAAAAGIMAQQPPAKVNIDALKKAFISSILTDRQENDAQLAILDALYRLDKKESVSSLLFALTATDYLVRLKAVQLIKSGDFTKDFPGIPAMLAGAKTTVQPFAAYTGTKLGQILNTTADYTRAVSRKNGSVKAVLSTSKGNFTIEFAPEEAPLTVDNFIKLARTNYFNNVSIHRVVPNFVMQDGDPRGDGNGGPGWSIRCEINMLSYERGAIGMALSGKDTGGSQWFATHAPQPHLDGGYTVFGRVSETDMKVVDDLVRGDKILSVKIIEGNSPIRRKRQP